LLQLGHISSEEMMSDSSFSRLSISAVSFLISFHRVALYGIIYDTPSCGEGCLNTGEWWRKQGCPKTRATVLSLRKSALRVKE